MSLLGRSVPRVEDRRFLTGGATYVDNLDLPGAAHVTWVRSPVAHAGVRSVDVDAARHSPGVLAVLTGADVDLDPIPAVRGAHRQMARPWLATDTVRYVGEPVAVVITEERDQGPDAAELVVVDYDPRPAVVDPEAALEGGELLFPSAGTNLAVDRSTAPRPDLFDRCEVVVRQRVVNRRVAPCPLEVRAAAARWDEGRLTLWVSTQCAHYARNDVAGVLGVDPGTVRVIAPDVGGGFGAKISLYPEELVLGWLARVVGRSLRWLETRSESMVNLGHGRAQVQHTEIGGTRDGVIEAYRLTVLQDAGAYPRGGALMPDSTRAIATGGYRIGRAEFGYRSVVTSTTPTVAYRGAGRPEAIAAIERSVDLFAAEVGLDPADVRRRNLIPPSSFPYENALGTRYDSGNYTRALDTALATVGYESLRGEQAERRQRRDTRQLGIGMSVYLESSNGGPTDEFGAVEVRPDGTAFVRTGVSPHGQGHTTALAMLTSERLGIPLERIEVVHGDTDVVPSGGGTMGSRSLQTGGVAVSRAAGEVADRARKLAAERLDANPDDIVLDPGSGGLGVAGSPSRSVSWSELAGAFPGELSAEVTFAPESPTYPFGAHVAVVEVDIETGKVDLVRFVTCDDAGRVLNPLLAEGQIHGGVAQGAAQALLEEVRYDDDGNPLTTSFADYAIPGASELPMIECTLMETPTPHNELGAKGIGEAGATGSTPAAQNAVVDALAHLGVRHIDMPCTPERVWRAIERALGNGDGRGSRDAWGDRDGPASSERGGRS